MKVNFFGPTYSGRSNSADPSRSINLYPEFSPNPYSKSEVILVGTPGTDVLIDVGNGGPIRGLYSFAGLLFIISANSLYSWDGDVLTTVGSLRTDSGSVSISDNGLASNGVGGNQMMIVDGVEGYLYDAVKKEFSTISRELTGEISSVTMIRKGTGYRSIPTVDAIGGGGEGAKFTVQMGIVSATVLKPGLNYQVDDEVALEGEYVEQAVAKVTAVRAVSVYTDLLGQASGSGYIEGDLVTLTGGTYTVPTDATVATVNGTGGILTLTIYTPGSYTVVPTGQITLSGGSGTGGKVYAYWGADLLEMSVNGKYSSILPNPISQATPSHIISARPVSSSSGYKVGDELTGVGGTYPDPDLNTPFIVKVDTVSGGKIKTLSVLDPGSYLETPRSPISTTTDGDGTGQTVDVVWDIGSGLVVRAKWGVTYVVVDEGGSEYSLTQTGIRFVGGGGNPAASAEPTISIRNGGFPPVPMRVTYLDGYFVVISGMSHWSSDLYDGSKWNPLAFGSAISSPKPLISCAGYKGQLYLIKEDGMEVWYNAGVSTTVGTPFATLKGVPIDVGSLAIHSIAQIGDSLFMVGGTKGVSGGSGTGNTEFNGIVQMVGYQGGVVSPQAITNRMGRLSRLDDAIGYCYLESGHQFYVVTFPEGNATFVYDVTTQMWHERSTYSEAVDRRNPNRHLSNCYTKWGGKHVVGDYRSGKVLEMSEEFVRDGEDPIISTRIAPILHDKMDLSDLFFYRMYVDAEMGNTDDGSADPKATLSWSDDGGWTWSNEYEASMGKIGSRMTRLIWRRVGYSYNRVFDLTISDPIKKVLISAYADVSE